MNIKSKLINGRSIYDLNLRVVYYARVSTEVQSQTTSITNQIAYFENYIKNIKAWTKVGSYIDEGISGKDIKNRYSFQRMIIDGLNNKYDLILTKSVSRFARNTIDSIKYTNILLEHDIGVYFINDNINTFASDSEFRLTLMASIAQDEIRKLSESVKFGLHQSIKRGVVLGNNNILGYRKNKGKLKINKKEAIIVREIFTSFITNNYTYTSLASYINNKYKTKFYSTSIKRILTNYKYKGYYCGNKTTVINYKKSKRKVNNLDEWVIYKDTRNIPPIIEEDVWDMANYIVRDRARSKKRHYDIVCTIHKKHLKYINKKYKGHLYNYYYCPKCVSIDEKIFQRIEPTWNRKKFFITKLDYYIKIDVDDIKKEYFSS